MTGRRSGRIGKETTVQRKEGVADAAADAMHANVNPPPAVTPANLAAQWSNCPPMNPACQPSAPLPAMQAVAPFFSVSGLEHHRAIAAFWSHLSVCLSGLLD
jgi:hypothetical protein